MVGSSLTTRSMAPRPAGVMSACPLSNSSAFFSSIRKPASSTAVFTCPTSPCCSIIWSIFSFNASNDGGGAVRDSAADTSSNRWRLTFDIARARMRNASRRLITST